MKVQLTITTENGPLVKKIQLKSFTEDSMGIIINQFLNSSNSSDINEFRFLNLKSGKQKVFDSMGNIITKFPEEVENIWNDFMLEVENGEELFHSYPNGYQHSLYIDEYINEYIFAINGNVIEMAEVNDSDEFIIDCKQHIKDMLDGKEPFEPNF